MVERTDQEKIQRMKAAIVMWAAAAYPENRPSPYDMEGRAQAAKALEIAESTLYQIAKEP